MVVLSSCLHYYLFILIYIPCLIFSTHHFCTSHWQFNILLFFPFITGIFILDSFFLTDIFILDILKSMVYETLCTYCILYTRIWDFDHWAFEPSFISFLSPYHLKLHYIPGLKTTLRQWYHTLYFDGSHMGDIWDWPESILIVDSCPVGYFNQKYL